MLANTISTLALIATLAISRVVANGITFLPCPELNANISALIGIQITPFDCAQLPVPLDYTDSSSPALNISVFRVNATEEPVLGTVILNFGGPGGTGAENLPAWAKQAHANIGAQWNLVSWDPRGTGYTIPFRCNITTSSGANARIQKRELGSLAGVNLTEVFLSYGWDYAGQQADSCFDQSDKKTATLIGTVATVRDMMRIVDSLNEDGLLRYYGWSYGTALGSYAAAMFPERIERMVLDGNLNPYEYQAGTYQDLATDTDEAFAGFLETCFNVTDDCALYSLVKPNRTEDLLNAINDKLAPLAQKANAGGEAFQLYFTLKGFLFNPLYYPNTWPTFAENLASLLNGTLPTNESDVPTGTYGEAENAVIGIRASDATFHANCSDEYLPIVEREAKISPSFSDLLFAVWVSSRWRLPAKERYWGAFRATTRTPILYVNGLFDPVTPIQNAYNASAGFKGSAVLPHTGYGHGIFVSPSKCVAEHMQAYYRNGSLPGGNVTCEADMTPVELWKSVLSNE